MRNTFSVIGLAMLLSIAGCTKYNSPVWSSEGVECQRLRIFWERMGKGNPQIIIPEINTEFGHESGDEMTWQELGEMVFFAAGCCSSRPNALAKEWMEYNRLECIRQYLENESVRRIAFYGHFLGEDTERPEDWGKPWAEITESERIKEVTKLLLKAMEKEGDRFANEISFNRLMQIITDKHKFIIAVCDYEGAIRGIGWTSYELRKKFERWGFLKPKKVRSAQEDADSLALCVETSRKQVFELVAQHEWLKHRLDKCLEKLEAERGLTPIPRDNPAEDMYAVRRGGKVDPNETIKYAPKPEPFYVPYEEPNQRGLPTDGHYEIGKITALLGLQCTATSMYMWDSKSWIENFEQRLKRLDPNQP